MFARLDIMARIPRQSFRCFLSTITSQNASPKAVVEQIRTKVNGDRSSHLGIFLGLGQHYNDPKQNRVLVLSLGDQWSPFRNTLPKELLDVRIDCSFQDIVDAVKAAQIGQTIYTGEVDCLGEEPWEYGYTTEDFSIFSRYLGPLLWKKAYFTGPRFCLKNGRQVRPEDVSSVRLDMSQEPWESRELGLEIDSGEGSEKERVKILETRCTSERISGDPLANLVLTTEWLVRAGAQLCLALSRSSSRADRAKPQLKLPRLLLGEGNIYVQLRNEIWAKGKKEL